MTTSLHLGPGGTTVVLPVVPRGDRPVPRFRPLEPDTDTLAGYGSIDVGTTSGYGEISSVDRDPRTGATRVVATNVNASRFPWGEEHNTESITHEASDARPDSTTVRGSRDRRPWASSGVGCD